MVIDFGPYHRGWLARGPCRADDRVSCALDRSPPKPERFVDAPRLREVEYQIMRVVHRRFLLKYPVLAPSWTPQVWRYGD